MKRVVLLLIAACGGAQEPVVIPTSPPQSVADAGAPEAGSPITQDTTPSPKNAKELVGPGGAIVPADVESILFVNGAEIRKRQNPDAWRRAIQVTLVGWNMFMPVDLIDPIDEIDWTMMAGSLYLGQTERNQFLAHYNVSSARATEIRAALLTRLPKAKKEPGMDFSAEIDGAKRAYLSPKPGVLAIVPMNEAASAAEILKAADVTANIRAKELLRVMWPGNRHTGIARFFPRGVDNVSIWVKDENGGLVARAEGTCKTEDDAKQASDELRATIARSCHGFSRVLMGGLCTPDIDTNGGHIAFRADVPEQLIEAVSAGRNVSPP